MKILILSQEAWNKNESFGNSYSNIFGKVKDIEIAHIYLMNGLPDYEPVISQYYQIPEGDVMKSLFKRKTTKVGKRVFITNQSDIVNSEALDENQKKSFYSKLLEFGKRKHWRVLFWARECVWKFGNINYDGMMDFIREFAPDVFFLSYNHIFYSNRIAKYICDNYNVPLVTEIAMDHYSLNRYSFDPLFWIDRLSKREMISSLAERSSFIYVISKKLKEEYEQILDCECKILYKIPNIARSISSYSHIDGKVKFLFTGNIYANRWKTLAMLAHELKKQRFGHLDIYTSTPISKKMDRLLNIPGVSSIHPPVAQDKVIELQNGADVLVHVEAFDKFNKSLVRCAISTKIMDYLSVGRCILAIGPNDISSIEYLSDNNTALVASDDESLARVISKIRENPEVLYEYAQRSLKYCTEQLNAEKKRQELYDNLQWAIDNYHINNIVLKKN